MKKSLWIGKKGLRYWYYNFRDSEYYSLSLIALVIMVSLFLLFNIIIPETSQWFSIRREVIATRQNIAILQQNINLMDNLDKNTLNTQLQTASAALPPEKNFTAMLNAITSAAAQSGVSLNDYSFGVGDIASGNDRTTNPTDKGVSNTVISVVIIGNFTKIIKFITALENSVPLAEISEINGSGQNVSITLLFYQKSFPTVTFSGESPIEPVTTSKVTLLENLKKWEITTQLQIPQSASGSGNTVPLF